VDDALLEYYNPHKGCAYPGYARLCRDTGLSRDAVGEALHELEFYHRWVIHRTPRRTNVYRLPPELVPDVPAARYVPSARWTRKERLAVLHASRPSSAAASRGRHAAASRGPSTGTTQLTTHIEPRIGNAIFHTNGEKPEKPRKEDIILRYRTFWRSSGEGEEIFPGVRRALAAALGCPEEEAGTLLAGAR